MTIYRQTTSDHTYTIETHPGVLPYEVCRYDFSDQTASYFFTTEEKARKFLPKLIAEDGRWEHFTCEEDKVTY